MTDVRVKFYLFARMQGQPHFVGPLELAGIQYLCQAHISRARRARSVEHQMWDHPVTVQSLTTSISSFTFAQGTGYAV